MEKSITDATTPESLEKELHIKPKRKCLAKQRGISARWRAGLRLRESTLYKAMKDMSLSTN